MALSLRNISFSRQILPALAVVGAIGAVAYIATSQPDRTLEEPTREPPRATGALATGDRVAGSGVVEPASETLDIGSALSGLVLDVMIQPGDRVGQGQPLFKVDDRAVRAQLRQAEASIGEARAAIAEAQAARTTAERELALYRSVEDSAAVSRAEVIRAEGEASSARSRLALAQARLEAAKAAAGAARTELDRLTVRAPIAGEVLAVNIRKGEYVSTMGGAQSQPFVQMGQTIPLHVRVDIDESEATRVDFGKSARVSPRGAANSQVEARFVRAEPLVVPKRSLTNSSQERVDVRVLQVIYELPNRDDGLFRVGQQVDAYIPARKAR